MKKFTRLPGCSNLTDNEYKEYSLTEKKQYDQRLNMICPSKEIKRAAKEIAEDTSSCAKCIYYCPNEIDYCRVPHTKAYMDALGINPCYEGALFYLCKEIENKQQERGLTFKEIDSLLEEYRAAIYTTIKAVNTLTDVVLDISCKGVSLSASALKNVREINGIALEILDDWDDEEDEYGFDDGDDDDYFDDDYDFDDEDWDNTYDAWDDWDYYFGDGGKD